MGLFAIGILAILIIWAIWLALALTLIVRVFRLLWWVFWLGSGVHEERQEQRLFEEEEALIKEVLEQVACGTLDLE